MDARTWLQLAEALGPDNRWYCCEKSRKPIDNPDILVQHYIKSGGAKDFAFRYSAAMSELNRWYCSEFYKRDVRDWRILFQYYMQHYRDGEKNPPA